MKVLLLDLDITRRRRPSPNLALMKLSAYHKSKGDDVFLNFPLGRPDITYASCVFTWNAKKKPMAPYDAICGGSGIDLKAELPPDVEHAMPDYSLYAGVDSSIGFTSRGCIRRCPWCIVPEKEGAIKPWARIYEFWDRRHRNITLLDNNLLAAPNWRQTVEDLIAEDLMVDFNQGLDIRLLKEEHVHYLKLLKWHELRFAFDHISEETAVKKGIELLLESGINSRKLSFYILHGFDNDDHIIERLAILHNYNVDIYPMAYRDFYGREPERRLLQVPSYQWHGSRGNIKKFLRLVGRLPE